MPRWVNDEDFPEYVSVGERRRKAQRDLEKLGTAFPVVISGSQISKSFWGKSWCKNLESYSDYANRLPRGRTYVRNNCVVDLQISPEIVAASVSGSRLYDVVVKVSPIPKLRWSNICQDCTGAIDSMVELLEGRFSKLTMERMCEQRTGLFPAPSELKFSCNCPDSARMCKHIAAVLYGIGARLDEKPELLFTLRNVDQQDLIKDAGRRVSKTKTVRLLQNTDLSELFGIDIVEGNARRKKRR